ncbi:MAG: hypothetical protein J6Y78_05205 [Paludibacteraceae bacterium]|jgi:hypothetical protein|nr:hypothetical protein [Paludibacteraceae bacterium]
MKQATKAEKAIIIIGIIVLGIQAILLFNQAFNARVRAEIDKYFEENHVWYYLEEIY